MNVLHIASGRSWRGGERQVKFLIDGLNNSDIDTYILCPLQSEVDIRINNRTVRIGYFRRGVTGMMRNLMSLRSGVKRHNINIIHGHDSHAHSLIWLALKFGFIDAKCVVTRRLDNGIKERSRDKYNEKGISKIICISDKVKSTVLKAIDDPDRLVTIYSGVDTNKKYASRGLGTSQKIVVGYVAAFSNEKNHYHFLLVAKRLMAMDDRIQFRLVGDGPLRSEIESQALFLGGRIHFTGFVSDVEREYERIDIVLHTSDTEALGTSILDAMKHGVPIVARNVGGVPEIVIHGRNGFLYDGEIDQAVEFILRMINDADLYAAISANNVDEVGRFSKDRMIDQTIQLYRKLI